MVEAGVSTFITWPVPTMRHPNRSVFAGAFMLLFALPVFAPKMATRLRDKSWHKNGARSVMRLASPVQARLQQHHHFVSCICAIMLKISQNPLGKAFWLATRQCPSFVSIRIKS